MDFLWILLSSFAQMLVESHCLAIFSTSSYDKSWNIFLVKLQKLEDELVAARKVSSERQLAVTDVCALHLLAAYLWKSVSVELQLFVWWNHYMQLYKHFLQLQDYNDRVKTAEQRLQVVFSNIVFLLFPYTYSCHHEITICSTWPCSQKITHHWPFWCGSKWYTNTSVSYQSLVNAAMVELDMGEDATTRDGSIYENGVVWTSGRRQLYGFSVTNLLDF